MFKLYTGTSGYSYQDWRGNFYPDKLNPKDYLYYYSRIFNTVEINFTYYAIPTPSMIYNLCKKVEDVKDFLFSIKANKIFTHDRDFSNDDVLNFLKAMEPLTETNRLGSILFQFPYSFHYNKKNMDYLKNTADSFSGYNICVEFRNTLWLNEDVINEMKHKYLGFCNVDEPSLKGLMPATSFCTNDTGYIRFHGRNAGSWWKHEHAYQRYDYMYKSSELEEWAPRIREIKGKAKKAFVYFNNHYKGKAAESALLFMKILNKNNPDGPDNNNDNNTSQN